MCAQDSDAVADDTEAELFPPHLGLSEIQAGLKNKKFVQGKFHRIRDNCFEATISIHDTDEQVNTSTSLATCMATVVKVVGRKGYHGF